MKHLRAIVASPKTSVPGIVMILGGIGLVIADWTALLRPKEATVIVGDLIIGIGLLMSAQITVETPPKPQDRPAGPQ